MYNAFRIIRNQHIYIAALHYPQELSTAGLASSTQVCPAVPGPPAIETATLASVTSATVTFLAPQHTGESVNYVLYRSFFP